MNRENSMNTATPMMQQFMEVKKRHPHELLFFRMGDFYELFLEDAIEAARILDIALTRRQDKVPMCGVPHHSVHNYIKKALLAGKNIAICEQVEDPATVSGRIVKRDVVRIITPGTVYEENLLQDVQSDLLAALMLNNSEAQILLCDISTGTLTLLQCALEKLPSTLEIHHVKEIIAANDTTIDEIPGVKLVRRDHHIHSKNKTDIIFKDNFQIQNLDVLPNLTEAKPLLLQIFGYLAEIAPLLRISWRPPLKEIEQEFMQLDESALKSLEVLQGQDGNKKNSLFGVLNLCVTAQGKRLLEKSLARPLLNQKKIQERLDSVEFLIHEKILAGDITSRLKHCSDLERIITQLQIHPQIKHLLAIKDTLLYLAEMIGLLQNQQHPPQLISALSQSEFPVALLELLKAALTEDPPPFLDERRVFRKGYSSSLDDFLILSESAQEILLQLEDRLKKETGIATLKIRYNKVIGYFIEVSKGQTEKVPDYFIRRQTLVNGERYSCDELSTLEEKIYGAKDQVIMLQKSLFQDLTNQTLEYLAGLRFWSHQIAQLDMLTSFATVSQLRSYIKPQLFNGHELQLKKSRHPVVEALFEKEIFIANDVFLNNEDKHLAILTGPNMAGKSTYIRQIGLIQIMAQAGCFVPANSAILPLVDKLFTRIGAYDRLHKGESTFYVEMSECAKILHHYTTSSLILLDEVGRGTSTFDGISICKAMIDFFNQEADGRRAKILFATHYSELAEMIDPAKGIFGLTVSVVEENGKITFLRRIVEGQADKSYGIHVAQLAGMPNSVIQDAQKYLRELEETGLIQNNTVQAKSENPTEIRKRSQAKEATFSADNQIHLF